MISLHAFETCNCPLCKGRLPSWPRPQARLRPAQHGPPRGPGRRGMAGARPPAPAAARAARLGRMGRMGTCTQCSMKIAA